MSKKGHDAPGVDEIIRYENGDMDQEEELNFFTRLRDSGMLYHLQGSYGRAAHRLGLI